MTEETPIKEKAGSTSNEDLRELVEEWRDESVDLVPHMDDYQIARNGCADELEDLIDDE